MPCPAVAPRSYNAALSLLFFAALRRRFRMPISPISDIVDELRAGRMVVLVDEEDRENEGDLVLAAQHVSAEAINFMATHGRGLICLTLTRARCERIGLRPMVQSNTS